MTKIERSASLERQVSLLRSEIDRMQHGAYVSGAASHSQRLLLHAGRQTHPPRYHWSKIRNAAVQRFVDAFEECLHNLLFLPAVVLARLWAVLLYFGAILRPYDPPGPSGKPNLPRNPYIISLELKLQNIDILNSVAWG